MKKSILFIALSLITGLSLQAQKAQRIAYIDMQYILQNIPDYKKAESQLDGKVQQWKKKIGKLENEIKAMKEDLSNEKALLTQSMIEEREEDIALKEEDLRSMRELYFGAEGELYQLRKQLVKPIQDQVYNSIQEIASRRKYDFVLDKSSDLIMLYSNDKYDISDMVIKSITKGIRIEEMKEKRTQRKKQMEARKNNTGKESEALQKKNEEREKKKKELQEKVQKQREERKKQREERLKQIEEQRKKRLAEREAAQKKLEEKKLKFKKIQENPEGPKEDSAKKISKDSLNPSASKKTTRQPDNNVKQPKETEEKTDNKEPAEKLKTEQQKKKEELQRMIEERRKKRLAEREKKKKELEAKRRALMEKHNKPKDTIIPDNQ